MSAFRSGWIDAKSHLVFFGEASVINSLGERRDRTSRARARGRLRPGLESLEVRQVLAATPLATTLDRSGNPVDFLIRSDASVVVNQERPTNDITSPIQYSGYQTLSGLSASSITAFTLPNGDPAVVAMTGPQSYLYLNRYTATGNPAVPRAWTGWEQFGSFVATSVASASNGASGAAVFAVGVDAKVYAAPYDPSTTATAASTAFSGFQQLPGFSASSISVLADGASSYSVTALGGPESYVEDNKVIVAGGTVQPVGWQQVGNWVAISINLTPGLNTTAIGTSLGDRLFLFAVGTDGVLYYDPLTLDATTGERDSTTYVADSPNHQTVSSSAVLSAGYMTIYAMSGTGSIAYQQLTATGLTGNPLSETGWGILNAPFYNPYNPPQPQFVATAMTTSPTADGGSDLVALDFTGVTNIKHLVAHPAVSAPSYTIQNNQYSIWTDLGTNSYHPIATASGPNGLPIVVTLGSDGSVYANRDVTAGTSGAADTYSGFTRLDGLSATSIAATTEPNGFAVFALIGPQSSIYENQYVATGDSTNPYAWTGWNQLGDWVATSIAAATPSHANSAAGATVFGLGVNGVIAATGATVAGNDPSQAVYTPFNGLGATSFSVKALGSQVLIAALTNTQSYPFSNLYTPPGQGVSRSPTTPGSSAWTLTGTDVLSKVVASTTPSGDPVVAGVSPSGAPAVSLSLDGTNPPQGSPGNFQSLSFPYQTNIQGYLPYYTGLGFVPLAIADGSAVGYLELVQANGYYSYLEGVYLATTIPNGMSDTYYQPISGSSAFRFVATSTEPTSNSIVVGDSLGQIFVSQATATGDTQAPLSFSSFVSLGTV